MPLFKTCPHCVKVWLFKFVSLTKPWEGFRDEESKGFWAWKGYKTDASTNRFEPSMGKGVQSYLKCIPCIHTCL